MMKIEKQSQKYIDWKMVTIDKYFKVIDENGLSVDDQYLFDNSEEFSPVICEILIRIIVGSFDMDKFKFSVTNQLYIKIEYWFVPKLERDGGPLEVFADQNFKN